MAEKEARRDAEPANVREDFAVLFPGQHVEIETQKGKIGWTVYPVAFRQMQKFSNEVGRAIVALSSMQIRRGSTIEEHARSILPAVIPIILEDVLDLVADCCQPDTGIKLDVRDLPHWHMAPIVEAWFDQSFGGPEKLRPWVAAFERAASRLTGRHVDLWAELSRLSSPPATA